MQIGVHLPHIGRKATPEVITRAAIQAEELGLADVWVSEHVILPKDAPYPPSPAFLEPILTLAWAAAATRRVRLGTSVIVLPMHHPVPIAKQLATLQTLSNGRVIFGIGVGWLEAEFAALGVPFRERGRRADESIALLRALWSQDPVTFKPRYWMTQIEEMRMQPPPSAPIPLWVGGSSEKALERAVKLCDGWHGSRLTAEAAAPVIKRLRTVRPDKTFTISLRTSFDGKDPAELGARLGAYRDAGADHVMVSPKIATPTTGCARWRRSPARRARTKPLERFESIAGPRTDRRGPAPRSFMDSRSASNASLPALTKHRIVRI